MYAIKFKDRWFIAEKAHTRDYGRELVREFGDTEVWAEDQTTALICGIDDPETVVDLDNVAS